MTAVGLTNKDKETIRTNYPNLQRFFDLHYNTHYTKNPLQYQIKDLRPEQYVLLDGEPCGIDGYKWENIAQVGDYNTHPMFQKRNRRPATHVIRFDVLGLTERIVKTYGDKFTIDAATLLIADYIMDTLPVPQNLLHDIDAWRHAGQLPCLFNKLNGQYNITNKPFSYEFSYHKRKINPACYCTTHGRCKGIHLPAKITDGGTWTTIHGETIE